MNRTLFITSFFSLVFACFSLVLKGQERPLSADSAGIRQAEVLYHQKMAGQSGIYTGPIYTGYPHATKEGHQFFDSTDKKVGSIRYRDMVFKNVPMLYDIAQDQPMVLYPDGLSMVALHRDFVDYFEMPGGHRFVRIDTVRAKKAQIDAGFYDEIHSGSYKVMVKRSKTLLRRTDADGIWMLFSKEKRRFYVVKNETFLPASTQKHALAAFGVFREEMLAGLRTNRIKFRKSPEEALKLMAKTADNLTAKK